VLEKRIVQAGMKKTRHLYRMCALVRKLFHAKAALLRNNLNKHSPPVIEFSWKRENERYEQDSKMRSPSAELKMEKSKKS